MHVHIGQHHWKIRIDEEDNKQSWHFVIGVATKIAYLDDLFEGWGYVGPMNALTHPDNRGNFFTTGCPPYGRGDVIGVHLDLDGHVLKFSKNGTYLAHFFTDVKPPVLPAITIGGRGTATLMFE
jgi:SPRY domain